MQPKFLDLLCCPETREPLRLDARETLFSGDVVTGELASLSGRRYPIVRGVPRFVSQEYYTSSFGVEWKRWPRVQFDSENVGRPMAGHTTRMWEAITRASSDRVQGTTVVEFGCGPGRFLDVVRQKGGTAVGIDLSTAVEAARKNFAHDPSVLIVQGDICKPPFREGIFEGGYAIGVLHHTPDPQEALRALVRTVRPGGWIACVVYPSKGFYAYPSVARFRRLVNRLQPVFGYRHALAYSYLSAFAFAPLFRRGKRVSRLNRLLQHIQENWVVVLDHLPDFRWRVLDTFDAITPLIASTHTGDEVKGWMRAAGCTNIETAGWGETSVLGARA